MIQSLFGCELGITLVGLSNKKTMALALLDEVAAYVISVSKGDRALIFSSGFEVIDEQTGPIKPSIETLEVESGARSGYI